jgi:CBS domain-containing protein/gamma-glutamyl:cysteine ligase YbdK (ATP-grasp superfamily)
MGEHRIHDKPAREEVRAFTGALLEDLRALERMLNSGMIEGDVRRIGAEQEMFLVDRAMGPALKSVEVLKELDDPKFTTELGLFNIEANLTPQVFEKDCLSRLEEELERTIAQVRVAAKACDAHVLLTGILPTIKANDLTLDSITPEPRYCELNRAIIEHRGGRFRLAIKGLDELRHTHDNVMCEACNTSFQIHFQTAPNEFANLYNLAQAITAPVLAAAVYSPFFLQHRLWQETRLALFQQAVDIRSDAHQARQARPRVAFGDSWIKESVLEIFREDIARFRVLLTTELPEPATDVLDRGGIPELKALRLHNGTVYRWNRPCFGLHDGRPHLRIEHRVLPAGPTIIDEMANAAFFFGLMTAMSEEYHDVTKVMSFDDTKNNVVAAARYGLKSRFQWVGGEQYAAEDLILQHLLPLARSGLKSKQILSGDIDRYLGVVEERVRSGRTGSQWALDSLSQMGNKRRRDERFRAITAAMYQNHLSGRPVHEWEPATLGDARDWRHSYRTVEQVMTTDLFTVGPEDLVDLAANLMDWEHIRHVPVEDKDGRLVGLISHRHLLRLVGQGLMKGDRQVAVREVMATNPITVRPDTGALDAIAIMRKRRVSCLPVVDKENRLVGVVSERDFINVAAKLLEDKLSES